MPYDPRPISEGGNRGVGERFQRNAPKGKYRVVGVDTFEGRDWLEGDFKTLKQAKSHANKQTKGEKMLKMHVYDDTGAHRHESGTF